MMYLGHGFFELLIATQASPHRTPLEVRKPAFPPGIPDVVAIWRKQRTGTFVTSPEPAMRASCDISQWTGRYWIAGGKSWAPCASMNFTLVISTRSHDSSPARPTQIVPEKVHAVPFSRKFDIVHVLIEAFLGFLYKCPDSPISTIYYTEFHHKPLPTPTRAGICLHIALNLQFQNISVVFGHRMVKNYDVLDWDRNFW